MIEQEEEQVTTQDTEITLGMGKLLAIFFIAVIVCGAFFGMGYSLGKNSTPLNPMGQSMAGISASSGGNKPTAGTVAKPLPPDCATSAAGCVPSQNTPDNSTTASVTQPATLDGSAASSSGQSSGTPVSSPASGNAPTPDLNGAGQNLMVQVAAVTKQEDAEALVNALRKKNYPVFVLGSTATDKLFHVQVGPFAELKEAEAMKSKLVGDGYNAIVKR